MKISIKKMVWSGVWLAAAMLLPLLTGQIPQIGNMLSPMHIPVLLCGLTCGWPYGAAVGLIAPPLRFLLFGMPPIFPTGVAMMFELAAYGAAAGLFLAMLPKKPWSVYPSLVLAMLAGRLVWGAVSWLLHTVILGTPFTLAMFWANGFVKAVPGIIVHILIIPPIVLAFKRAGLLQPTPAQQT